jgi:3-hydroxybutyryl-CoA dehydrogenase
VSTERPDRFLGLHFFNPVQVMKLIDVIRCVTTSDETLATGIEFGKSLGKLTAETRDQSGFIVNRLLVPCVLDAIPAHEEGVARSPRSIRRWVGAGHPMGPFTLADFVGLDTLGLICDVLFDEFRERRFARPPTLRQLLAAGWYGRKSGRGFYDSGDEPVAVELR